jgi:hypothetical protein
MWNGPPRTYLGPIRPRLTEVFMSNRTIILAAAAVIAILIGFAAGFFELIVLGAIAGIVALWLGLKRQPAPETSGR